MKHIVIFGPTAVGKTSLSVELAKHLDAEIISADATQIYRELNIGSAKVTKEEMQGIKHHMIDILNIGDRFSAIQFADRVKSIIKELERRGKRAIIVGGTGFYIQTLIEDSTPIPTSESLRSQLMQKSIDLLRIKLKKVDPISESRVKDKRRIVRALEVYYLTGRPLSSFKRSASKEFDFVKIGLIKDREELYESIDRRVDAMVRDGLLEEAKSIYDKYIYNKYSNGVKDSDRVKNANRVKANRVIDAIGYRELFRHIEGEVDLNRAIEDIKRESRRYAKRQLTWLKSRDFSVVNNPSLKTVLKLVE